MDRPDDTDVKRGRSRGPIMRSPDCPRQHRTSSLEVIVLRLVPLSGLGVALLALLLLPAILTTSPILLWVTSDDPGGRELSRAFLDGVVLPLYLAASYATSQIKAYTDRTTGASEA
jgi:hypothetical protein